jgi:hypothetical protein
MKTAGRAQSIPRLVKGRNPALKMSLNLPTFSRPRINGRSLKEPLNKLIPSMVRQAHHEPEVAQPKVEQRNQPPTVRPELVEGLIQIFTNSCSFSVPSLIV